MRKPGRASQGERIIIFSNESVSQKDYLQTAEEKNTHP
jgi:hypothetical protein